MKNLFGSRAIHISELKDNLGKVLNEVSQKPIAVINHIQPVFYIVEPKTFEAMIKEFTANESIW